MNFQNMKFLSEQEIWRQTIWLSKLKNWNSVRRNEKLNHILMTWNTIPWNLKFTLWHICETYKSCMKIYVHSTMTCKQKTHYVSTIDPSCPQLSYLGGLTGRICSSHFQTISLFTRVAGRSCAGRQAFHPRWFAIHWQDAQPAIWGVPNSKKPKLNGKPSINSECSSINVGFSQTQWRLYNRNIIHKWLIFHGIFPFCQVCGHGRIQPSVCRMMD